MVNYKSNARNFRDDSLLQKIEMSNSHPLGVAWKITISEFKLNRGDINQTPPDAKENLVKSYVFSKSSVPTITVEFQGCGDGASREELFTRTDKLPGLVNIFKHLPDREHAESKARVIFKQFHDDTWMIDGVLCHELAKAEDEERICLNSVNMTSRKVKSTQEDSDEQEMNVHASSHESEELVAVKTDELKTEDEIWESRGPEQVYQSQEPGIFTPDSHVDGELPIFNIVGRTVDAGTFEDIETNDANINEYDSVDEVWKSHSPASQDDWPLPLFAESLLHGKFL